MAFAAQDVARRRCRSRARRSPYARVSPPSAARSAAAGPPPRRQRRYARSPASASPTRSTACAYRPAAAPDATSGSAPKRASTSRARIRSSSSRSASAQRRQEPLGLRYDGPPRAAPAAAVPRPSGHRVARRSSGSGARSTSPRASRASTTSVAERGAMRSRSASAESRAGSSARARSAAPGPGPGVTSHCGERRAEPPAQGAGDRHQQVAGASWLQDSGAWNRS